MIRYSSLQQYHAVAVLSPVIHELSKARVPVGVMTAAGSRPVDAQVRQQCLPLRLQPSCMMHRPLFDLLLQANNCLLACSKQL